MGAEPVPVRNKTTRSERNDRIVDEVSNVAEVKEGQPKNFGSAT